MGILATGWGILPILSVRPSVRRRSVENRGAVSETDDQPGEPVSPPVHGTPSADRSRARYDAFFGDASAFSDPNHVWDEMNGGPLDEQ